MRQFQVFIYLKIHVSLEKYVFSQYDKIFVVHMHDHISGMFGRALLHASPCILHGIQGGSLCYPRITLCYSKYAPLSFITYYINKHMLSAWKFFSRKLKHELLTVFGTGKIISFLVSDSPCYRGDCNK